MSNLTGRAVYQKGTKPKTKGKLYHLKRADREYLDWIKTHPCCFCNKAPPSDPAHVRLNCRGGIGMKPLFSAVPLCRFCHITQHSKGHTSLMPTDEWLALADKYLKKWSQHK